MTNKRNKPNILIIDDDPKFHQKLRLSLDDSFDTKSVLTSTKAYEVLDDYQFDAILLDLALEGDGRYEVGLKLIQPLKTKSNLPIIIITADGRTETILEATKQGADYYLMKNDFDPTKWNTKILEILDKSDVQSEKLSKAKNQRETVTFISVSESLEKIKKKLQKLAQYPNYNLLILGETGVGKEVAAKYFQQFSTRKDKPFVKVNVSELSESTIESELFGHVKGAFTGADKYKKGYFEAADGGILFLDEIGLVSLEAQTKLLRVLHEQTIHPVGSVVSKKIDVQLVFATNKNLEEKVMEGSFKEDFYARINEVEIHIPPLRERKDDIIPLLDFFLSQEKICPKTTDFYGVPAQSVFTERALSILTTYDWPHNVRQLQTTLKRCIIQADLDDTNQIDANHIPNLPRFEVKSDNSPYVVSMQEGRFHLRDLKPYEQLKVIENTLKNTPSKSTAARILNIEGYDRDKKAQNLRSKVRSLYKKYPRLVRDFPTIIQAYKLATYLKILLIDDDRSFCQKFQLHFRDSFEVKSIHTAKELSTCLDDIDSYDLVLLDLNLKGDFTELEGINLVEPIRKKSQHIPIVAITGYSRITKIDKEHIKDVTSNLFYKPILNHDSFLKDIFHLIGNKEITRFEAKLNNFESNLSTQREESLIELEQLLIDLKENADLNSEQLINISVYERRIEQLKVDFQRIQNAISTNYIELIGVKDLLLFKNLFWYPERSINVLLGRNGYGKSLIFKLIAALLSEEEEYVHHIINTEKERDAEIQIDIKRERTEEIEDLSIEIKAAINFTDKLLLAPIPILTIPASRTLVRAGGWGNNQALDWELPDTSGQKSLIELCLESFIYQTPSAPILYYVFGKLLSHKERNSAQKAPIFGIIEAVYLDLTGDTLEFTKIARSKFENGSIRIEVRVNNRPEMSITTASQGTISIISIICLIYEYLFELNPDLDAPNEASGIVFIDEVDISLHPSWQQKIIQNLRKHFPNVQFFLTAHSPLIAAGCFEHEVAILERGRHTIKQFPNDFIGYTTEELYKIVSTIDPDDKNYLYYLSLEPFVGKYKERIEELETIQEGSNELSKDEDQELSELYEKIAYNTKAKEKFKKRNELEKLRIENRILKRKLKFKSN